MRENFMRPGFCLFSQRDLGRMKFYAFKEVPICIHYPRLLWAL